MFVMSHDVLKTKKVWNRKTASKLAKYHQIYLDHWNIKQISNLLSLNLVPLNLGGHDRSLPLVFVESESKVNSLPLEVASWMSLAKLGEQAEKAVW